MKKIVDMLEEKKRSGKKVNAWIPDDLYSKVDDLKNRSSRSQKALVEILVIILNAT
jgi:hypothetical protein